MSRFRLGVDYQVLSSDYRDWIKRNGTYRDAQGIRFGQQFCNCYLVPGESFPELFNEEDAYEAFCLAYRELKNQR